MAHLPADRTKLNAAVANQQPSIVASAQANRESMVEAYDTIDLLNQKVDGLVSGELLKQAPLGNAILNAGMDIWQRGTSFRVTATSWGYAPDRFSVGRGGSGGYTLARSTDAPSGFNYSARCHTPDASVTAYSFRQAIEAMNAKKLAGNIVLSLWVKATANATFVARLEKLNSRDSGISSTTLISGASYTGSTATAWQRVSASFQLSDTDVENGLVLFIRYDGAASGGEFYVTGIQLEPGVEVTPFHYRDIGFELALCQRYYCKTYNQSSAPGAVTFTGEIFSTVVASNANANILSWDFPTTMRTSPTVTIYSPQTGAANKMYNIETSSDIDVTVSTAAERGANFRPANNGDISVGNRLRAQVAADAEI